MEPLDPYIRVLAYLVIAIVPLSLGATAYSWYLAYKYRHEGVGLAFVIAIVNTLALIPAIYFGAVGYWRLTGAEPPSWGTTFFATGIVLSDAIPLITVAYLMFRHFRPGSNRE